MTVVPSSFTLVSYDAEEIARLVSDAAGWYGITAEDILITVDEGSPLTLSEIRSTDPIELWFEGGAFEDLKKIRTLDPVGTQVAVIRLLARIADRRKPSFADAPADEDLSFPQLDCWDAYALGRATRHGLAVRPGRWRYRFRNRHGFTDSADRVFDRLWGTDELSWSEIDAACAATRAVQPTP